MSTRLLCFTDTGFEVAQRIASVIGGEVSRCGQTPGLDTWTRAAFAEADALVFVGALGIAVRAIAPYVESKAHDPAVVVVDETGQFAISVLSGHLGGANDLAHAVAQVIGATPVITTATDCHGVFAIDSWARVQGCSIPDTSGITRVSMQLLHGEEIRLRCPWPIAGEAPHGVTVVSELPVDVVVGCNTVDEQVLLVVPRIVVAGIGCRKGTPASRIEALYQDVLDEHDIHSCAVRCVASIDLKENEPGLQEFCANRHLDLMTYSAQELAAVPGEFSDSAFVASVTGVDSVCDRAAVKSSGGRLIVSKMSRDGVTVALAEAPFTPDWSWQDVRS